MVCLVVLLVPALPSVASAEPSAVDFDDMFDPPADPKPSALLQSDRGSTEWFGIRLLAGVGTISLETEVVFPMGALELSLFTLRWQYFYWEMLRITGGYPQIVGGGTHFGVPIQLDGMGNHELRVGVHLSVYLPLPFPTWSGLQMAYLYRVGQSARLEFGLQQYSYPFGVALFFGLKI